MRVVRYGRGYAGGILGGAIHPEMGRRNGALHPPRVSGPLQLRTLGFGYVLSMHMGMSGRPFPRTSEQQRVLGTSDQMTPPHTHTRTLRCTARSSTRSWLDCRAPTSIIHLPTNNIVSNSFLTVLRAEPRCRRPENRSIKREEMRPIAIENGRKGVPDGCANVFGSREPRPTKPLGQNHEIRKIASRRTGPDNAGMIRA
jgi:hypothetical protein